MSRKQASLRNSAQSFLEAGINSFQREDFGSARVFLGLAGELFSESKDSWNAHVVQGWYESTLVKLGENTHR
jgi:hypothetical protein